MAALAEVPSSAATMALDLSLMPLTPVSCCWVSGSTACAAAACCCLCCPGLAICASSATSQRLRGEGRPNHLTKTLAARETTCEGEPAGTFMWRAATGVSCRWRLVGRLDWPLRSRSTVRTHDNAIEQDCALRQPPPDPCQASRSPACPLEHIAGTETPLGEHGTSYGLTDRAYTSGTSAPTS